MRRDVKLAPDFLNVFVASRDGLGRQINAIVKPFHLEFTPIAGGLRITGHGAVLGFAGDLLSRLADGLASGRPVDARAVQDLGSRVLHDALKHDLAFLLKGITHPLRPMSLGQVAFMNAMLEGASQLIFGIGSTGTGKTHLGLAAGVSLVAEQRFKTLIVSRPHVPDEGVVMTAELRAETAYHEQLAPIEDVLHELIGHDETRRMIEHGLLQILPLGRMRGRTFNDSFVLVDEAQNLTIRKMRMVLTRLGRASQMVVIGDPAQIDLRGDEPSGLEHAVHLIEGADIASVYRFQPSQIVRNDLVARIEALYAGENAAERRAA